MEQPQAADPPDIDALVRMDVADDGEQAALVLFDNVGRSVALHLPMRMLGPLIAALPRLPPADVAGDAFVVRSWRIDTRGDGPGVRMSLETPDGRPARFRVLPGTIMGTGESLFRPAILN